MLIHYCKHQSEDLNSRLITAPGELSGSGGTRLSPIAVILTEGTYTIGVSPPPSL